MITKVFLRFYGIRYFCRQRPFRILSVIVSSHFIGDFERKNAVWKNRKNEPLAYWCRRQILQLLLQSSRCHFSLSIKKGAFSSSQVERFFPPKKKWTKRDKEGIFCMMTPLWARINYRKREKLMISAIFQIFTREFGFCFDVEHSRGQCFLKQGRTLPRGFRAEKNKWRWKFLWNKIVLFRDYTVVPFRTRTIGENVRFWYHYMTKARKNWPEVYFSKVWTFLLVKSL